MASDSPTDSAGPRRSQRERKPVIVFAQENNLGKGKRRRQGSDTEAGVPDRNGHVSNDDAQEDTSDDADAEEEGYRAPKPKSPGKKTPSKNATPKAKGPSPAKRSRVAKTSGEKPAKSTATKRGRRAKQGDDAFDATQVAKDTRITADNPLFNAIMNPSAALQSTAEDFLESLQQTPGAALSELINFILRACGCNDSVNSDEVSDYDGVVDALDNFTEGLKQDNSPVYPLTSKLPVFKKFRKSLSEFIERLIASSADLNALYTSDIMETLQVWVIAMSSSQIRSFRHTATVIALEVETALCDVAAAVEKEAEVVGRQREGEKKRKSSNKSTGAREKELEAKAQEIRKRKSKLMEFLKEFVDGVFVHRYRDFDSAIRAECVRAIGLWFRKFPGHFLDGSYLRYVGWVLSDSDTHVRLEAVKSLSGVYDQVDYISSLNHFTERFKPRLIEMATSDIEVSVRVAVIHVLGSIDSHSLLEDDEREKLCLLVYDEEARVRKAVSRFVKGVWEEALDERLVGKHKPTDEDRQLAGLKAIAILMVKWCNKLDDLIGRDEEEDDIDEPAGDGQTIGQVNKQKEAILLAMVDQKGRTSLAVEALWDEVDSVRDWETLLDLLLLDHSALGEESQIASTSRSRRRANGKVNTPDSAVDEAWRLDDAEETVLLEVLVATLRRAKAEAFGGKKGEDENLMNDITRELIKGLPHLFIKYQSDQNRIADVLLIPTIMNLDLYLEMRMITSYASLWDDVTKQFLSHSSLGVLSNAMAAIKYFMDATSLSNTNSTKILELEDELSTILHDIVAGREEIEVASFSEDEVLLLGALSTRLAIIFGNRNMTSWMEEDEGGKQSSAWDIFNALVERGRLGYKEEETMVEQALSVLTLHIIWKAKCLIHETEQTPEDIKFRETLVAQREALLEKLVEYAVGTQSNTTENVKRTAFKNLLDLHVLFSPGERADSNGVVLPISTISLSLDDEIQYRCAGYIQAEIERYVDALGITRGDYEKDQNGSGNDTGAEDPAEDNAGMNKMSKEKKIFDIDMSSKARLEQEYLFVDVMSTFLRAIRAGVIHVRHGHVILAHYGRLGLAFDACAKVIIDVLREEGMMNDHGDDVVPVIVQALQEAYTLVLDGVVRDESNALQLSKLLATCFVIRGSQLSIIRRIDSQYVVQLHTELLAWIIKRLAVYDSNKNKKSLKLSILFFKVLVPLLGTIPSRDALKIKAFMDQIIAQTKMETLSTSKLWEPQKSYEKKLSAAMSKEKGTGRKGKKAAAGMTTDEEATDGELLTEIEAHESQRPRPKPRPKRRSRMAAEHVEGTDDEVEEAQVDPSTPKARPRLESTHQEKTSDELSPDYALTNITSLATAPRPSASPPSEAAQNGVVTPKVSRKRTRSHEPQDIEAEDIIAPSSDAEAALDDNDIQIRRKRVRH